MSDPEAQQQPSENAVKLLQEAKRQSVKNLNPYAYRPARQQAKPGKRANTNSELQHTGEYNIWYGLYSGGDRERNSRREAVNPGYRCSIDKDAGYTAGDKNDAAYLCLYFARGCCDKGDKCPYLHRPPNEHDEIRVGMSKDVFGRDRHSTDRDDMGGVGSFNKNNRTIYIAGIRIEPSDDPMEIIRRHFKEWGEIERANYIPGRAIGFVTYKLRVAAEFAKEAMANQQLDHNEVLDVRWAFEDPNPKRQEEDRKTQLKRAAQALLSANPVLQSYMSAMPEAPTAKRNKADSEQETVSAYPQTDVQYTESEQERHNREAQQYYGGHYVWNEQSQSWVVNPSNTRTQAYYGYLNSTAAQAMAQLEQERNQDGRMYLPTDPTTSSSSSTGGPGGADSAEYSTNYQQATEADDDDAQLAELLRQQEEAMYGSKK